jgi:protein O-mannosyl-transferase
MQNSIITPLRSFYKTRPYVVLSVFLFLLSFVTYVNILPNLLFFDDEELIYKNVYVSNLKYLPKYFTSNMVAGAGKISNMYRPILLSSFAFDHAIWNNKPIGYHLTSIVLHGTNSILVFFLILLLFNNQFMAFITAILFVLHPIQTEPIIYASGRTDPLFTFFALLSVLSYISFLKKFRFQTIFYIFSCIFFILSILSKETAITLPFLLILVYYVLEKSKDWNTRRLLASIQPFFLFGIIYIFLRLTVLNFANTLNFYQDSNIYSQNLSVRFFTFARVFFAYLKILIFPKDLIIARTVQIITNPINPYVIAFTVLILTVFIISSILWKINKIFLFSFLWFAITIAPVSGIIPINNIITEHYMYFPSIAFFLVFGYFVNLLWKLQNNAGIRFFFLVVLITIFISLFTRTFIRTFDWRDPITFYTISLKQSPWHIPMKHNLAMAYSEKGKTDIAISIYQDIVKSGDFYPNTHHNLANLYKTLGKYKEAEEEYKKALIMNPNFTFSYYGLFDLYKKTGEKNKLDEITKVINNFNK